MCGKNNIIFYSTIKVDVFSKNFKEHFKNFTAFVSGWISILVQIFKPIFLILARYFAEKIFLLLTFLSTFAFLFEN